MSYNKALVSNIQKTVIKSITELVDVLSEIEISDTNGNSGEIMLDDGSVMTLSLAADKNCNPLHVEKISVTSARLNLDIIVSKTKQNLSQDENVIRLIKKKPEKIVLTLKKKTEHSDN